MEKEHKEHFIPYGTYILVWLSLISLTVLTVTIAGIDFGRFSLFIALLIAAVKSTFVINYFMHIKFDDLIFKVFLLVALVTLASIFILTSTDIFFR
ncbi:MAG: Cytochrome c oxidase polypeptide IV [Candidatus Kapaibacterium sp.]|jgi:cytochrome c oxidase subunit 4|nr:MAG: Cytochrome c oxidase polypeptide IV [Candidatus Kapabacteria bacterium]ROL57769.1 MAG: cytochrome-c oxidase [Bacteroidetes/Chlorobi group bacterium Naka2016]